MRGFALIGAVLVIAGLALGTLAGPGVTRLGRSLLWPGGSFALTALLMTLSSRFGKLRARDRLLDRLAIGTSDTVLDVGCGHGLMLLGAAQRATQGHVIGVDLWSQRDQGDNRAEATLENAVREGVRERVEVRDGDMRSLPLDDASVDVVVSSLAIHNIPDAAGRATACREMVRVLRPGGRVGILDIANISAYAKSFRAAGLAVEHTGFTPWIFPPTRELVVRKPG